MDFITSAQLIAALLPCCLAAMQAWVFDKNKSIGQILCEQKVLTADNQTWLEIGVEKHLMGI